MKARTVWTYRALALAGVAATITIAQAENFTQWAPVISSTPIVQRVNQPRQECWNETVTTAEVRRLAHIGIGAFDTSANVVVPVTRDVERCRTVDLARGVAPGQAGDAAARV